MNLTEVFPRGCSSCKKREVHCVVVFYNGNQLPYCEDCWTVMFCSLITPGEARPQDENSGIAAAGKPKAF